MKRSDESWSLLDASWSHGATASARRHLDVASGAGSE
jgi:hypothetical protein